MALDVGGVCVLATHEVKAADDSYDPVLRGATEVEPRRSLRRVRGSENEW